VDLLDLDFEAAPRAADLDLLGAVHQLLYVLYVAYEFFLS
jgi:hypothetical protein